MTSDQLFWRLVLASRTVDEALLLWWLSAVGAESTSYRTSSRELSRYFGGVTAQNTLVRAARALAARNLMDLRIVRQASLEFRLRADEMNLLLGQFGSMHATKQLIQIDPVVPRLSPSSTVARFCMLRGNREDAVLLAWLCLIGSAKLAVCIPTRALERDLLGLVDRRTAMRAASRLAAAGLLKVTPQGRAGTQYQLDLVALDALLNTNPFGDAAAATMPGWANLSFPLLQRLAPLGAEADHAAHEAALEA